MEWRGSMYCGRYWTIVCMAHTSHIMMLCRLVHSSAYNDPRLSASGNKRCKCIEQENVSLVWSNSPNCGRYYDWRDLAYWRVLYHGGLVEEILAEAGIFVLIEDQNSTSFLLHRKVQRCYSSAGPTSGYTLLVTSST